MPGVERKLIGDDTQRKPVAGRGRAPIVELLRGEITGRAHDLALRRERRLAVVPRDAEVRHVDVPSRVEKQVCRLDVAMHDFRGVRVVQRVGGLREPLHRLRSWRCAVLPELVREAPARHVFEHDVRPLLPLARLVSRDDARMHPEPARERRFPGEPLAHDRVAGELLRQDLDRDVPAEHGIPGEEHRAHPAATE